MATPQKGGVMNRNFGYTCSKGDIGNALSFSCRGAHSNYLHLTAFLFYACLYLGKRPCALFIYLWPRPRIQVLRFAALLSIPLFQVPIFFLLPSSSPHRSNHAAITAVPGRQRFFARGKGACLCVPTDQPRWTTPVPECRCEQSGNSFNIELVVSGCPPCPLIKPRYAPTAHPSSTHQSSRLFLKPRTQTYFYGC